MKLGLGIAVTQDSLRKTGASLPPPDPPQSATAPVVSLSSGVLSTTNGTWTGGAVAYYAYQWERDGVAIDGATNQTYAIPSEYLCRTYSCVVSAYNAGGSASAESSGLYAGMIDVLEISPTAAYSLRRLTNSYSGALIRVRRSSDNAEQDFTYGSNGKLDTAAVLAFCGAGDGLVTTWYSQMGGINAEQATALKQPSIVKAGVLNASGSLPMVLGDGSDVTNGDIMTMGTGFNANSGLTVNAVARVMVTTGFPRIVSKWNNLSVEGDWLMAPASANASRFGIREGTSNKIAAISLALDTTAMHIHTGIFSAAGATVTSYYDSTYSASLPTLGTPLANSAATVSLFKDTHPSTVPAQIGISEVLIIPEALTTAKRLALEGSQMNCILNG